MKPTSSVSSPWLLPHELAEVELPGLRQLRRTLVTEVRVVRPHDDLCRPAGALQMGDELVERLGHVPVAQVPALHPAAEHRPVVLLGVDHEPGVLLGEELPVRVDRPVPARHGLKLDELLYRLLLARLRACDAGLVRVDLRIAAELVEARVALPRPLRRLAIDAVEVLDHRLHRPVEAVEVEAVEADLRRRGRERVVVLAQERHELRHLDVAPHPGREAPEVAERLLRGRVVARRAHEAVDPVGVRPVGLDRDGREAALGDQALRDLRALAVELLRAVRRLPDEDEAGLRRALDQVVVVRRLATERSHRLRAAGDRGTARLLEQHPDLVVGRLREVLVPDSHGLQRPGCDHAHHVVGHGAQAVAHVRVGDRDGDDDPRRLVGPQGMQRRQHGRPRGQPVVDEDDRAAGDVGRRAVTAVRLLAALQLAPLLGVDRLDPLGRQIQRLDQLGVENADTTGGDRAERVLLVSRHAELAHEKHVQGRVQRPRDLVADGHATARQGEHDDIVAARVVAQPLREQPAGVRPVPEALRPCRSLWHLVPPLGRPGAASSPEVATAGTAA